MSGLRGLRQPIGRGGGQKVPKKFSEISSAFRVKEHKSQLDSLEKGVG
jgi:hypothetical protein